MLAYQHAYHAGNFADIHKHLVLFSLLEKIRRKGSAVTYVDTHAGRGDYPLAAAETQKLQEYQHGVLPIWQARHKLSAANPLLRGWLEALQRAQHKNGSQLNHYPGSPWWLAQGIRDQDRLSLFELHPGEHQHLEKQALPGNARRIHGDGLQGMRRMLPVKTPRFCVLIDPSYERKEEYAEVAEALALVARKARHAQVLIWFPLLPAGRHQILLDNAKRAGLRKLWRSELHIRAPGEGAHGMYGSGMLLYNPPWGLEDELQSALQIMAATMYSEGTHQGDWWVEE